MLLFIMEVDKCISFHKQEDFLEFFFAYFPSSTESVKCNTPLYILQRAENLAIRFTFHNMISSDLCLEFLFSAPLNFFIKILECTDK